MTAELRDNTAVRGAHPHVVQARALGPRALLRDGDEVYRTYLIDARGDEALGSTWSLLDITPYGRQEEWEDYPAGWPQTPPYTWGGWHDNYDHSL